MPDGLDEPKLVSNIKRYALFYGAGAVAALQALKIDIFSFPPGVRIYLGYFFSLVTIACIFLGGSSVLGWIRQMNVMVKKIDQIKKIDIESQTQTKEEVKP